MDDLSLEAIECTKPDGGVVSSSDKKAVIAFLMLSQDELDLRAQRWISADTWELCRVGLTTHLRPWPFDVVWDEVRDRESEAVDGQFSPLPKAAGSRLNEVGFDPATEGKRRPWQAPAGDDDKRTPPHPTASHRPKPAAPRWRLRARELPGRGRANTSGV